MDKVVVVAHYNENLDWLKHLTCPFLVYDKGQNAAPGWISPRSWIGLPNVGGEAHTFLYHIKTNYDNLDEITIFTQADPFPHFRQFDIVGAFNRENTKGLRLYGRRRICDRDGYPSYSPGRGIWLKECFEQLFPGRICPTYFFHTCTAHFAVNRKRIQERSKSFYGHAVKVVHKTKYGGCMERLWPVVFNMRPEEA